jgi:hypothetical protein
VTSEEQKTRLQLYALHSPLVSDHCFPETPTKKALVVATICLRVSLFVKVS